MAANIPRPSVIENVSTTLSSAITDIATTISVADASNFVAPCYLMIDRVDAAGAVKTSSLWELVKVTSIVSNDLTVTRAQNGTTGQAHSSGAVIEAVVSSAMFEEWYTVLNTDHDSAGGHVISGTATVATLRNYTNLSVSGASITGIERTFVWYMPGFASAATTNVMRLIAPFAGTFQAFTMMTRTPVSTASLQVTLFKNGNTSVFDTIGMPLILGGGTFASTASIKNKTFNRGDILTSDIITGGNVADITLEGIAY